MKDYPINLSNINIEDFRYLKKLVDGGVIEYFGDTENKPRYICKGCNQDIKDKIKRISKKNPMKL